MHERIRNWPIAPSVGERAECRFADPFDECTAVAPQHIFELYPELGDLQLMKDRPRAARAANGGSRNQRTSARPEPVGQRSGAVTTIHNHRFKVAVGDETAKAGIDGLRSFQPLARATKEQTPDLIRGQASVDADGLDDRQVTRRRQEPRLDMGASGSLGHQGGGSAHRVRPRHRLGVGRSGSGHWR